MKRYSTILLGCLAVTWSLRAAEEAPALKLVAAARAQIGKTVRYDPAYRTLAYPNGDVPLEAGVCTDVVIRALRAGLAIDLQRLVHEDMKSHFAEYPQKWGLKSPDKNIDHRRVPNLQTYFKRQGYELPVTQKAQDYQAGDLVTCLVPPNLPHIMLVSDQKNQAGRPLVLHNIGSGTQEEDRLFEFKLTGHYRVAKAKRSVGIPKIGPIRAATPSSIPQIRLAAKWEFAWPRDFSLGG